MSVELDVVRRLFAAVEERDLDRVLDCYDEDVEIHEAGVLPYGGVWRGYGGAAGHAAAFAQAWARSRVRTRCASIRASAKTAPGP